MASILETTADILKYNRKNFMYDKKQQQEFHYTNQEMNVTRFELYREDIRDLINLTVCKMDNYLIINTLLLMFCFLLLTEGKPEPGDWPSWLHWLYGASTVGAALYFVLSMWLGLHATVAASAFGVRMLTQIVRLPVPTKEQIEAASAHAQDFERLGHEAVLRIPMVRQQWARVSSMMSAPMDHETSDDVGPAAPDVNANQPETDRQGGNLYSGTPVAMLKHIEEYRRMQVNWQAYDAYTRVCMAMGANQFLYAMSYYTIGVLIAENHFPWPALTVVIVFAMCAWLLARFDLYVARRTLSYIGFLQIAPPALIMVSVTIYKNNERQAHEAHIMISLAFLLHVVWIGSTFGLARTSGTGSCLPKYWRSVLYLDVFGRLDDANSTEPPAQGVVEAEHRCAPSPALMASLRSECHRLSAELSKDLERWNSDDVKDILERDGTYNYMHPRIQDLRQRYDSILARVRLGRAPSEPAERAESENVAVWLRLEYNGYESIEYFYRRESFTIIWEVPEQPCRISDLESMEQLLRDLDAKVDTLRQAPEPGPDHPAQEAQFGGSEAVPVQEYSAWRDAFLSQGAGPTFHPHQEASVQDSAGRPGRPPPGQLPRLTFIQGSFALLAAWTGGTLWLLIHTWGGVDIGINPVPKEVEPIKGLERIGLEEVRWPHPLFSPRSIACHPALGHRLLVADRYGVHALDLEGAMNADTEALQQELARCLGSAPRAFRAQGIEDVTIHCADSTSQQGMDCSVVLLSAAGGHGEDSAGVLRCALSTLGKQTTSRLPEHLVLPSAVGRGTRLRSVAAPVAAADGDLGGERIWALVERRGVSARTVMQLRTQPAAVSSGSSWTGQRLAPEFEIPWEALANVTRLNVLRSGAFLGVEPATGRMVAWHPTPEGGSRLHAWQLPAAPGRAKHIGWAGACVGPGDILYLAGDVGFEEEQGGGSGACAALWRAPLPSKLLLAEAVQRSSQM